jgi:hypothetical protein
MNERITKIVIDTLGKEGVVNSRVYGHWALSDEELEKFAELIVNECCQQLLKEDIRYGGYGYNQYELHNKLREHFGVEE